MWIMLHDSPRTSFSIIEVHRAILTHKTSCHCKARSLQTQFALSVKEACC